MIFILAQRIRFAIHRIARTFFWHYNLSRAKIGSIRALQWPIIVEGKGHWTAGSNLSLGHRCVISVGKGGKLRIGDNARIEANTEVRVGDDVHAHIGDSFTIETGSRLFIQKNWHIGDRVAIATNCAVFSRESPVCGTLQIGPGTHIGDNTIIDVSDYITIGREVAIGPNCVIYTHDHDYSEVSKPAWKGQLKTAAISIGDGSWIGANVILLPGVSIGKKSVIAAGAVVTRNVPAHTLWGGIPAKQIKEIGMLK